VQHAAAIALRGVSVKLSLPTIAALEPMAELLTLARITLAEGAWTEPRLSALALTLARALEVHRVSLADRAADVARLAAALCRYGADLGSPAHREAVEEYVAAAACVVAQSKVAIPWVERRLAALLAQLAAAREREDTRALVAAHAELRMCCHGRVCVDVTGRKFVTAAEVRHGVAVLYADLAGFTRLSSRLRPIELS
jgi:hypothetical protein